jgi:predicted permease
MIKALANALVPLFVGLLLGYLGVRGAMGNQNAETLTTLVMSVAVPKALFSAVAGTPFATLRHHIGRGERNCFHESIIR